MATSFAKMQVLPTARMISVHLANNNCSPVTSNDKLKIDYHPYCIMAPQASPRVSPRHIPQVSPKVSHPSLFAQVHSTLFLQPFHRKG
jgi:hypothetical protein